MRFTNVNERTGVFRRRVGTCGSLYEVLDILVYANALSDVGISRTAPWATVVGRIVLMLFGTLVTIYFVIVGSKRGQAAQDQL